MGKPGNEHPARKKLRRAMNLGESVHSDPIERAIARANATHYADARAAKKKPKSEPDTGPEVRINIKGNTKHRPSPETMERFKKAVEGGDEE